MKIGRWLNYRHACTLALLLGCALTGVILSAQRQPGSQQTTQQTPPQQPQSPPLSPRQITVQNDPIAVGVKVVNALATVRDKKGALVSDLTQDDFVIDEDGRTQTIIYFARDTDQPLTLGLLVDTSMNQQRVLPEERDASEAFLNDILRPDKDQAFLIHFDREVEMLQDVTSSRDKLQKALNEMDAPQLQQRDQNQDPYPQGGGYPRGGGRGQGGYGRGATLYDAVYLASQDVIQKQQGRKALIILSDGVDRGSKESIDIAIETAQRADTILYAIYFTDEQEQQRPFGFGGGPFGGGQGRPGGGRRYPQEERVDGKKILQRMTKETGGNVFEVSKKQTTAQIYTTISAELRNQYSLGYTPASDSGYGYHKIHLTTKQKDLTVQARDGYYGAP
jgi:VWFA-related protein